MRKLLTLFLLSVSLVSTAWSQDKAAAYRAQGRYYSAKEAFDTSRYDDAARMLRESREMLGGKSNIRLQYLLVVSLYKAGRFKEAQVEMNTYLTLIERSNQDKYANFPQDVDALTNDETRAITMIIDKIDSEVANDTEGKKAAAQAAAAKAAAAQAAAAKAAAELAARKAAAFNALKKCVLTNYVGKETPFPSDRTEYKINVSLQGNFDDLTIEILGTSDQTNDRNRWVPKHRHRMVCSVNLGKFKSFSIAKTEPYESRARAANGTRFSFREGGFTGSSVLTGMASGTTFLLRLNFTENFDLRTTRRDYDDEGNQNGVDSGDDTFSTWQLELPVQSEEAAREAVRAITMTLKSK